MNKINFLENKKSVGNFLSSKTSSSDIKNAIFNKLRQKN